MANEEMYAWNVVGALFHGSLGTIEWQQQQWLFAYNHTQHIVCMLFHAKRKPWHSNGTCKLVKSVSVEITVDPDFPGPKSIQCGFWVTSTKPNIQTQFHRHARPIRTKFSHQAYGIVFEN